MRLFLIASLILSIGSAAGAQDEPDPHAQPLDEPHSVLAFGIRTENAVGAVHGVTELRAGRVAAIEACEENSGGTQCIMAMAYPQCGAMAELQLGRALGNPVGWAPGQDRQALDIRTAMDRAMAQCEQGSRQIARERFSDDPQLSERVETAHCAIVYYHCTDWE